MPHTELVEPRASGPEALCRKRRAASSNRAIFQGHAFVIHLSRIQVGQTGRLVGQEIPGVHQLV